MPTDAGYRGCIEGVGLSKIDFCMREYLYALVSIVCGKGLILLVPCPD